MDFNHFVMLHYPHIDLTRLRPVTAALAADFGYTVIRHFIADYQDAMFALMDKRRKRAERRHEREMLERKPLHDKAQRQAIAKAFRELYDTQPLGRGYPEKRMTYKGYRVFFTVTEYPTPRGKQTYVEMYNMLKCVKRYKIHTQKPGDIKRAVSNLIKE